MPIIDTRARPPLPSFGRSYDAAPRAAAIESLHARGWNATKSMQTADFQGFLEEADQAGIGLIGVPARVPNELWGPGTESPNEAVLQDCAAHARRLYAYGAIRPDDPAPQETVAQLTRAGARGIVLEPGASAPYLLPDDRALDAHYDACQQARLPVLLMVGGEAGPTLAHCDPLHLDVVAARFPALQIVCVHGGWPFVQPTLGVAYRRQNVWMMPDCYFPRGVGSADYQAAAATFLQDRFLFATGYPYAPLGQMVDAYLAMGLPSATMDKIFHDNATRLFGLTG